MRAVLLALVLLAPLASADWSSFQGDAGNTGAANGIDVPEGAWWSVPTGPRIHAAPVVAGERVVLVDADGGVRAFQSNTGSLLWSATMPAAILSTPAVESGALFVAAVDGTLTKYSLNSGAVLATVSVGATQAPLTVHEGKLYVGNEAGEVRAYDIQSTEIRLDWTFKVSSVHTAIKTTGGGDSGQPVKTTCEGPHEADAIRGAPAVHDGRVFVASLNDHVYALDEGGKPDGTTDVLWTYRMGDNIWAGPVVDAARDRILVVSDDETVASFRASAGSPAGECNAPSTNHPRWQVDVGTKLRAAPAIAGNQAFIATKAGTLVALDAERGTSQWITALQGAADAAPIVAGDVVVAPSAAGVRFINRTDGLILDNFALAGPILSGVAVSDGRVYAASFEGDARAWGPALPTLPDYVLSNLQVGRTGVSVSVRNSGDATSPATQVTLTVNGNDLAPFEVPALAPGQTHLVEATLALKPGVHEVEAWIDLDGAVAEHNELDNYQRTRVDLAEAPRDIPAPWWALPVALAVAYCFRRQP